MGIIIFLIFSLLTYIIYRIEIFSNINIYYFFYYSFKIIILQYLIPFNYFINNFRNININISKIINKIIKWYQILQNNNLKRIIIKIININILEKFLFYRLYKLTKPM